MPRAKKTTPTVVATPATNTAPVDADGFYCLPKSLLMEYRALDSECRHAHLCLKVSAQELDALLSKHPEVVQKMAEKAALISECANKKGALIEVHRVIETMFNVKINEIAIDDLTGHIHQIESGAAAKNPMKQPTIEGKVPAARRAAKAKKKT
jgi:hypothetical protein